MKPKILVPMAVVLILAAYGFGRWMGSRHDAGTPASNLSQQHSGSAQHWTCAMHPQIVQPNPGKCPICAMDLVPVGADATSGLGPRQIRLSREAVALANIQTTPVVREMPTAEIRLVGKVDYDETRLTDITARFPGRLDRLYVDYTGLAVNAGDHLIEIYSPELLAAQEELLQAIRTAQDMGDSASDFLRQRVQATIQAAREKLLLWDLAPEQISQIEKRGTPNDRLTLHAPTSGIVIRKEAVEGKYVQTGTIIYTIADLSHVWILLDAYESDLVWLHFGQQVTFSTEAHPGETFEGRIAFIDPVLDPKTRTVRVRVNMDNPQGKLKPDMFVRATVRSQIVADGKVINPELAGKWISPMHPEIIRDEPGPCPVCGMDLVTAESLGYLPANLAVEETPLVIPATAPLRTGKRAVVYVALTNQPGTFEGRVVTLGPRAGQQYIVQDGLREGELVVTHGAFKIDSAVQIQAKPSMMNPEPPGPELLPAPDSFRQSLQHLAEAYFPLADALSHDDWTQTQTALTNLQSAWQTLSEDPTLPQNSQAAWQPVQTQLEDAMGQLIAATNLTTARAAFDPISQNLITTLDQFGAPPNTDVYVYHCPMAFSGQGADWLQAKQGTENPYYGSRMFSCGEEKRRLPGYDTTEETSATAPASPGPDQPTHSHNH